jgi:hypothetical protein
MTGDANMNSFLGGLFRDAALAFVHHVLAGIGVWLVAQHYATGADEAKWLGALMTALGLSWSFYDKWRRAQHPSPAREEDRGRRASAGGTRG